MVLRTRVLPRALVMFLPRYINTSCSTDITHANERTHAVAGRRLGTTRWRGVVTIEIRLDERAKALQPPVRHTHAGLAKDVRPLHHIRRRSTERLHEERSDRGRPPRFSATLRRIGDPQRLPYRATPPSTSHSMAGTSESRRQARRRKLDCTRIYRVSAVDSMRELKECIMYVVACGLYKVLQISHQIRTNLPGCHPRPKHSGSFLQ